MTAFVSADAVQTVRDRFNFNVVKRPMVMMLGTEAIETPCFGLFRDDNWKFVGAPGNTVSKQYVPHTTDDVISLVDATASVFEDSEVSCKCHWRDGHYVTIAPGKEYRRSIAGSDVIFPRLIIRAMYDGQAYKVSFGTFREKCANLMMTQKVAGLSVSIRHMSNLRDNIDDLLSDMSSFDGKWDELVNHWENLRAIENVNIDHFLTTAFAPPKETDSDNIKTRYIGMLKSMKIRLIGERYALTGSRGDESKANAWEMYNSVQGYMQHDMTRKNQATPFDRMLLVNKSSDKAFKDVTRVENMLLQMA